jgi:ATP-binding cassette, subfamily B, bacterial
VKEHVWPLVRKNAWLIVGTLAGVAVSTAIQIAGPLLVKYAIDDGISKRNSDPLRTAALVFLALALAKPLVQRAIVLMSAKAGERFLHDLRTATFERLQELSLPFFEREKAGVLVSRLTADVQTLTTFTRQVLVEVVGSVLLLVVTLAVLVSLSPLLTLVTAVALPLLAVAALRYRSRSQPAYLALRDRVADTMSSLQEGLAGVRVVQSFRREDDRYDDYRGRSRAQVAAWRRVSLVNVAFFPVVPLAQAVALAAVLLATRWVDVSLGTVVAFALYLISLFDPVARLGDWFSEFQSGRAALAKIVGLLETPVTVRGGEVELPARGTLAAEGIVFAYDGTPAVDGVSLSIAPGEHIALVGATGAGKSTLAKLLVRAYDPREGRITLGGVDLRDATLESLRRRIVFVPQEGHLFSGTLADNVRLARPDASDDDVRRALAAVGALERVAPLLDEDVRSRGVRLSSGERQLVALARVALVDPAVIVLDEATSSLDPQTEAAIEQALVAVARGRTVVTIAHRLSTAARADRVAVLDHARLVEVAAHDELVAHGERYAALWASWRAGLDGGAAAA